MFQDENLTNILKKAIIGNSIKCCGKFNTKYIIYAYDDFRQSPFKPKIPNFIPLFGLVQLDLQIKLYDYVI